MASLQELQRIDRELFSELTESPINPAFLHMSTPLIGKYDPMFYLQINGEALWQMRKLSGNPDKVFEALQYNLLQIGYKLSSSSLARVGIAVNSRVGYIVKKIRSISGGNERRAHSPAQKNDIVFFFFNSLLDSGSEQFQPVEKRHATVRYLHT